MVKRLIAAYKSMLGAKDGLQDFRARSYLMLKVRVPTAVVLLPASLFIFFVFPEDAFAFSVGLVVLIGAWEWIRLSGSQSTCYTEFITNLGGRFDLVVFSTLSYVPVLLL